MKTKICAVVAFVLLSGLQLRAQNKSTLTTDSLLNRINTITTSVPFLMISPDSRAGGMGDVGVATSADGMSFHWNIGKLAQIDNDMGITASYVPWLRNIVDDINLAYMSFYKKLSREHAFGASIRYFSLGEIVFTDANGNESSGKYEPNEFAVSGGYSRMLSDDFSMGATLKFFRSDLTQGYGSETGAKPATGMAVDLGGFYQTDFKLNEKDVDLTAGFAINNIGNKVSYGTSVDRDFIPINMRLGAGLNTHLDEFNEILFTFDINKLLVPTPPVRDSDGNVLHGKEDNVSVPVGIFQSFADAPGGFKEEINEFNISLGAEYWYDQQFAIRGGYFHEAPTKGARGYFTLGAGLKYNVFQMDFSYLISTEQQHPLNQTLRFTLLFMFEKGNGGESAED